MSVRPPTLPKSPTLPRGPKWMQRLRTNKVDLAGPGEPPPGFASATTSKLEWIVYWSLFKILIPTEDPRNPRGSSFYGYDGVFRYQKAFEGGRDPGGSLIDFVVEYGPKIKTQTAIRIQSVYRHQDAPIRQQATDRVRKIRIAAEVVVVDLWDYDLLLDNGTAGDGQKAIISTKAAVGMIELPSRASTGGARDVRYALGGR